MPRNLEVERVAETHFFIRPVLLRALENHHVTDEVRTMWNTHSTNWRELWTEQLSDRWFDMTTVIRLGTALETGLRDAYNRLGQGGNPQGGRGVFQRLVNDANIVAAFLNDCGGLNLRSCAEWPVMREVMLTDTCTHTAAGKSTKSTSTPTRDSQASTFAHTSLSTDTQHNRFTGSSHLLGFRTSSRRRDGSFVSSHERHATVAITLRLGPGLDAY